MVLNLCLVADLVLRAIPCCVVIFGVAVLLTVFARCSCAVDLLKCMGQAVLLQQSCLCVVGGAHTGPAADSHCMHHSATEPQILCACLIASRYS